MNVWALAHNILLRININDFILNQSSSSQVVINIAK